MTDKEKAKEIAKKVYPDLKREYYPNDETYKDDCNRLIDLRGGFVRGLLYKEEPVGEELEEATNAYISNENNYTHSRTDTFKAGAKWQEEKDDEEKVLIYKHGFNDCKEQMMAKAMDAKVIANGMGNPILHLWDKGRHLIGKKVKVIVIKED